MASKESPPSPSKDCLHNPSRTQTMCERSSPRSQHSLTCSSKKIAQWLKLTKQDQEDQGSFSAFRRKKRVIIDSDDESPNTRLSNSYARNRNTLSMIQSCSRDTPSNSPEISNTNQKQDNIQQETVRLSETQILSTNNHRQQTKSRGNNGNRPSCAMKGTQTASAKKLRMLFKDGGRDEQLCAICLSQIAEDKGLLKCKHSFCFSCIEPWSETSSKCPCCRVEFQQITRGSKVIKVESKQLEVSYDEDYLDSPCYFCGSLENSDMLILCDNCQNACCHLYCDPVLRRLGGYYPEGEWLCRACQFARAGGDSQRTVSHPYDWDQIVRRIEQRVLDQVDIQDEQDDYMDYSDIEEQRSTNILQNYVRRRQLGERAEPVAQRTRQRMGTRANPRPEVVPNSRRGRVR